MPSPVVILGAVAYDPKVITIWQGFRAWLRDRGLDVDFVLYSHYERQVEDLLANRLDVAWNSPLAWLRTTRLASAAGREAHAVVMRDTDRDLTSVIVVRADSLIQDVADLSGRQIAVGAIDSPQATLIPLAHVARNGIDATVRRFDVGVGLHGDHIGGERDAARALMAGEVDAACMIDANHLTFVKEGTLPVGGTRIVAQTERYDHCNLTAVDQLTEGVRRLGELLQSMSYSDPDVRPLLDLEGLTAWRPGRTSGYKLLDEAVTRFGLYADDGTVTAAEYFP